MQDIKQPRLYGTINPREMGEYLLNEKVSLDERKNYYQRLAGGIRREVAKIMTLEQMQKLEKFGLGLLQGPQESRELQRVS